MGTHRTAVFGIFPDQVTVERAVDALERRGFAASEISLLFADAPAGVPDLRVENTTKAPEGAIAGAATGAAVAGTIGWLAGLGALMIPGAGPLLAAGPLMAALAGVGVGGTLGGLAGALIGLGLPEYEARRFEGVVRRGGILLSVHADSPMKVRDAKAILDVAGAEDIGAEGEITDDPPAEDPTMRVTL